MHINGKDIPLHDWLLVRGITRVRPHGRVASDRSNLPTGVQQAHPSALGRSPYNETSALPYLFKVLAVAKALSIQVHMGAQALALDVLGSRAAH